MDMDRSFNISNTMEDVDQSEHYFESPVPTITTTRIPSCNRRHPVYKGIRCRSGKWVTEIREPRTTTRIWLGTYPTPEMAAAAHDAAALVLKGPDTSLNFPNHTYTTFVLLPTVDVAVQIRAVAANAAAFRAAVSESTVALAAPPTPNNNMNTFTTEKQYEDEEELLDMPNLLMDMANGMLVSPPRSMITTSSPSDDYVEENLWSFRF